MSPFRHLTVRETHDGLKYRSQRVLRDELFDAAMMRFSGEAKGHGLSFWQAIRGVRPV